MNEREAQAGDGETAICHICDRRFDTQEELSKHLIDDHPDTSFSQGSEN